MNAKEELLNLYSCEIKCASITFGGYIDNTTINLKVGHTKEELQKFLQDLDFDYDNGYGGQYLYGTIWYQDGTWAERGEYDGSEWWEHRVLPEIPEELQ